jgi:hypothetical protein
MLGGFTSRTPIVATCPCPAGSVHAGLDRRVKDAGDLEGARGREDGRPAFATRNRCHRQAATERSPAARGRSRRTALSLPVVMQLSRAAGKGRVAGEAPWCGDRSGRQRPVPRQRIVAKRFPQPHFLELARRGVRQVYHGCGYISGKEYWSRGAVLGVIVITVYRLIGYPYLMWFES